MGSRFDFDPDGSPAARAHLENWRAALLNPKSPERLRPAPISVAGVRTTALLSYDWQTATMGLP